MNLLAGRCAAWLQPLAERWLGRAIGTKLIDLRRHVTLPWHERRALAQHRLTQTLEHAGRHVPYYRDLFARIGFSANPHRLAELPYLTKDILRAEGVRLLDERCAPGGLHLRKTGGSTGPSTSVYYSHEALDWTAAVNRLALEWTGKTSYGREVHLSSRFPRHFPWRDRVREWFKATVLNRRNLETDAFEDADLEKIWAFLRRTRPFLLQGHPSTVYALARYLQRTGETADCAVQAFESAGETLTQVQTQAIASALGCRVFNRYGSAEFGVVAHQTQPCYGAPLHVFDAIVWPESAPSELGDELVLTGLLNPAMPLIRYRTGDLAQLAEEAGGFVLRDLRGRVHDVVRLAGKRTPTHYLQDVLDRLGGIDEFQCQERADGRLLLRLAVSDDSRQSEILSACAEWWQHHVEVEFVELAQLQRSGEHGKFRHLVPRAA